VAARVAELADSSRRVVATPWAATAAAWAASAAARAAAAAITEAAAALALAAEEVVGLSKSATIRAGHFTR
jgi:hypothetical protein